MEQQTKNILIKNAQIVNEGEIFVGDVLVKNGRIEKVSPSISATFATMEINADGKYLLPGIIDDQVHFREPGLTHKATIYSESRAAVAGGVTTFMEMPNTVPNTLTQELLEEKYQIASKTSLANYSFFMGGSNDNLVEILKTNPQNVCGIKLFMGSSTGNMLVDNPQTLEAIFSQSPMLIATHCEDENTIKKNAEVYRQKYGDAVDFAAHPDIRNEEACLLSSSLAVSLAKKYNTRLHILHISTEEELALFDNTKSLTEKRITAEACVHHLWFDKIDYERLGSQIKCNPAIKEPHHKKAILDALLADKIDVIATDHAPHTWEEKQGNYWQAPSGLPLVQHPLYIMLEFYKQGKISLEKIVEKMSHAVATCFQIHERGYVREGYWADLVIIDLEKTTKVRKENLLYRCGWSPLEGQIFHSQISHTLVSGNLAYANGVFDETEKGKRILFERHL
jgi:dihydroorotase